jgi:hypothetical protein
MFATTGCAGTVFKPVTKNVVIWPAVTRIPAGCE